MGTFEISNKKAQVFNSINKLRERSVTAVKHYKLKLHPKDILNKQQVFFLAIFINHILQFHLNRIGISHISNWMSICILEKTCILH